MALREHSPVAVIADAHFHDLEGDFGQDRMTGDHRLTARSWSETRCSTRVFNESFAALPAALDRIAARGIRHVVLLGDYSDDGQKATVAAVAALLERYAARFSMSFYILPGNHDGYARAGRHQTKEFLADDGRALNITSDPDVAATDPHAILTETMYCAGYPEALTPLARHGLTPCPGDFHWETPFGSSGAFEDRHYRLTSADGKRQADLVDASYLVEPEEGLWLLMIDANVFQPADDATGLCRASDFIDSTGAGWNAVIRQRRYLIDWIANVHRRAACDSKNLLCFSHYPVVDVFADNLESELALFGQTNVARRTPREDVAETLLQAGMTRHFSGHSHVYGSSERKTGDRTLTNIAVPSLVAFPPAFRIVHGAADGPTCETVSLADLPVDGRVVHLYRRECDRLGEPAHPAFDALSYGDFLYAHQEALVTHRFFPREWPQEMAALFSGSTLRRLLAQLDLPPSTLSDLARAGGVRTDALAALPLLRLVTDWYALRQAQDMALPFIPSDRLSIYKALADHGGIWPMEGASAATASGRQFLKTFLSVLRLSLDRACISR
ncbi:hypothetical protein ASG39_22395 [Rhizobium sp. Leaf371]|uniref:metallophosphoesterase family protein n=1 Tax=Rhizobium sp. Leaf371 TaxID=1736355 RepID=UPI000713D889|nr:metallophosphoesterase [Rhizobium sp. Leaf371]KQS69295.1 hypothetical protein ASG39_22395 [Rhizobium sp. Leaf371]